MAAGVLSAKTGIGGQITHSTALLAGSAALMAFVLYARQKTGVALMRVGAFGASIGVIYRMIVAGDHSHAPPPSTHLGSSGRSRPVFGTGSIAGPRVARLPMGHVGPRALFMTTTGAHVVLIARGLLRIRRRVAARAEADVGFHAAPGARLTTQQTPILSPSATKADEETQDPAAMAAARAVLANASEEDTS